MQNYKELGKKLIEQGIRQQTRLEPTLALHNQMLSFDLTKGFPLMTTKYVGPKSIIAETIWYLQGTTNIEYLEKNNVFVWSMFADKNKDIGKTYSYQFRNFCGVDQVKEVINQLSKFHEDGITDRRAIINLYNTADLKEMSIPPCIALLQFNIYEDQGTVYLDSSIYQRSADFCLGVPYDIAEMALITHIIAEYVDAVPRNMAIFYSNIHVYEPHIATLKLQLEEDIKELPKLEVSKLVKLTLPEDLTTDMFNITSIPKGRKKFSYELF